MAEQYNLNHNKFVIFVHCREPEEIARFVKDYDATTILICRPGTDNNEQSNHADNEVLNYSYDFHIFNDSTLDNLKETAIFFLEKILKK